MKVLEIAKEVMAEKLKLALKVCMELIEKNGS